MQKYCKTKLSELFEELGDLRKLFMIVSKGQEIPKQHFLKINQKLEKIMNFLMILK